ncbi:predicted permease [Corynebacterium kutscheri]|uniref:AEC family transporter n=1 Tax=Corynebacterium kutscheri TaxID=35755 RepID=UPI000F6B8E55|nr:AEC family transporter [Corynebacterium kutscheri]VEH79306.1 predicted permease [Corynebacterium kutscheri]
MLAVLHGFFIIFTVIFAGYLLSLTAIISSEEQRLILNKVAFYLATPALIFTVLAKAKPETLTSPIIGISTISALLTASIFVLFMRSDRASTTIGAASASYVNSNNIGLPVGIYMLGNAAYVAPLLLVQMVFFTPIILALIAPRKNWHSIIRAVSSPIVIGSVLGMCVSLLRIEIPGLVMDPLELIGGASIPMILLSFGASLRGAKPLSNNIYRRPMLFATTLKVVIMPMVAYCIGRLCGLPADQLYAVTILAALPTAQNIYNYAATYQRGEAVARNTVLLSTFCSLPAMLIIAALLSS